MTAQSNHTSTTLAAAAEHEFLIARGGPFWDAHARVGLVGTAAPPPMARALMYMAIAWVPLLVLSLTAGTAVEPRDGGGLLVDFRPYATYLVAMPVFVLMERPAERRLKTLLDQFVDAAIVPHERLADLQRHVRDALRLRNSWIAEITILALVYPVSYLTMQETVVLYGASWLGTPVDGGSQLSLAGWWAALVSGPLFGFLMVRWLWRYLIWANLIRRISRLDLQVATGHPDKTGGLAFVSQYPSVFSSFVFAVSSVVAAMVAREIVYAGAPIASFRHGVIAWIITMVVIYTIPLTTFSRPLNETKQRAVLRYGALASREAFAKQDQWLDRDPGSDKAEPEEPGVDVPGDLKARYEAARAMKTLPLGGRAILPISMAAAIPFAVAATTQLPVRDIIKMLKFLII